MAEGKLNRLSAEQRADMWRRWKAGESLHEIGRAFGKGHGVINARQRSVDLYPRRQVRGDRDTHRPSLVNAEALHWASCICAPERRPADQKSLALAASCNAIVRSFT